MSLFRRRSIERELSDEELAREDFPKLGRWLSESTPETGFLDEPVRRRPSPPMPGAGWSFAIRADYQWGSRYQKSSAVVPSATEGITNESSNSHRRPGRATEQR